MSEFMETVASKPSEDPSPVVGEDQSPGDRRVGYFLPLLVLLGVFATYVGTLDFGFVYDDHGQIVSNYLLRSWRFVPGYFTHGLWSQLFANFPNDYYRPLFLLWLRVCWWAYGHHAWAWHLTSVLLHVIATGIVYRLARRIFRERSSAIAAMVIFGFHPVHLEAVAWVSAVEELLMALAVMGSLLCFARWRDGAGMKWLGGALVLYAMGLLTKETAIVLPVLVFAWAFLLGPRREQIAGLKNLLHSSLQALGAVWTFVALTGVYLAVRIAVLHSMVWLFTVLPLKTLLLTIPELVVFYFRLLVWPVGLSEFYPLTYVMHASWGRFGFPLSIAGLALTCLILWAWRSRRIAFASIWLLLPIALVLNVQIFARGDLAHDRYLYLPSVGFAMIAAEALQHLRSALPRRGAWVHGGVVCVVALAGFLGVTSQSTPWANDILLGTQGVKIAPRSVPALSELATHLSLEGYYSKAIQLDRDAIKIEPEVWTPRYGLGVAYYKLRQFDEARKYFDEVARLSPGYTHTYYYLASINAAEGKYSSAESLIRHAIQLEPDDPRGYEALGQLFAAQDDMRRAIAAWHTALAKDPSNARVRKLLRQAKSKVQDK